MLSGTFIFEFLTNMCVYVCVSVCDVCLCLSMCVCVSVCVCVLLLQLYHIGKNSPLDIFM